MTVRNVWRGVFALLIIFITWQTLTPDPDDTEPSIEIARFIARVLFHNEAVSDKVAHFMAYAALGGAAAFAHLAISGRRWAMVGALALYGILLEYLQGLGGVRIADPSDALANAAGALSAFPLALAVERIFQRTSAA